MATAAHDAGVMTPAQSTPDQSSAGPTKDRIVAIDFVRGAALFGILLMNITSFGLPHAYSNPINAGGAEGLNLLSWMIIQIGFEGTQRGLFSILFGAGIILFTSRLEAKGRSDVADIYMRRNLWLAGFGLVNGFIFLWSGDILFYYGLIALIVFPFRALAARWLFVIAACVLAFGAAWNWSDTASLLERQAAHEIVEAEVAVATPDQKELAEEWEREVEKFEYTPEEQREYIEARTASYASAFEQVSEQTRQAQSWAFYRYIFFDVFSMMLIGLGMFRLGVFNFARPARFYFALVGVGYGIGLTVNTLETRWIIDNGFSLLAFSQAEVTYDLGRLATTAGHLGLLLLIARSGVFALFQHALACVGRMAFTNYLTHSVVCAIFFVGLGYYGQLERHQLYYVVVVICAVQLVISPLWLSRFRMGPLEWLWRALTYGELPEMRRGKVPAA